MHFSRLKPLLQKFYLAADFSDAAARATEKWLVLPSHEAFETSVTLKRVSET
jgi:hypothetical protein